MFEADAIVVAVAVTVAVAVNVANAETVVLPAVVDVEFATVLAARVAPADTG